jgi:hypothetical protein
MAQATVATEIHQPLDVHRDFTTQIAFDAIVTIDDLTDPNDIVVRQLMHAPIRRNTDFVDDFLSLGVSDAMNISQGNQDTLLRRDIDARNTRHRYFSLNFNGIDDGTKVTISPRARII